MGDVEIEAIIQHCLVSEDEKGAVRRGSDAGFLLAGRVDRARVKINDAMQKTVRCMRIGHLRQSYVYMSMPSEGTRQANFAPIKPNPGLTPCMPNGRGCVPQIQRSQSMGAAMSAREVENQLRRRIEAKVGELYTYIKHHITYNNGAPHSHLPPHPVSARVPLLLCTDPCFALAVLCGQTGDTNRLKAFRLLTHPMHQRSSSEAGPGSGTQGREGQSTVKLGDLASALQANNFYADKEVRHT
jgi:hypothetical protein